MAITYRGVKDEALTFEEVDENFRDLYEDTTLQRVLTNGNTSNLILVVSSAIVGNANVTLSFAATNAWANLISSQSSSQSKDYANTIAISVSAAANNWANTKIANTSATVNGGLKMTNIHLLSNVTISSNSSSGNVGQISWDGNYLYVCVATNRWKRTQLLSW